MVNPYHSPQDVGLPTDRAEEKDRRVFGRRVTRLERMIVFALLGATFCVVAYANIVFVLEAYLVPPLTPAENYGQFGFLILEVGLFGLAYGASIGWLTRARIAMWFLRCVAFLLLVGESGVWQHGDVQQVWCVSVLVLGVLIVALEQGIIGLIGQHKNSQ